MRSKIFGDIIVKTNTFRNVQPSTQRHEVEGEAGIKNQKLSHTPILKSEQPMLDSYTRHINGINIKLVIYLLWDVNK